MHEWFNVVCGEGDNPLYRVIRQARTQAYIVPAKTTGPALDFVASIGWWLAQAAWSNGGTFCLI